MGTKLEVVDKNRICRVRTASVISSIGKRLHLVYYDKNDVHGRSIRIIWVYKEYLLLLSVIFVSNVEFLLKLVIPKTCLQRISGVMRILL